MKIVGINGFKRSGKGESARILHERHDGVVYEVGFADKLKILGARILGYQHRNPKDAIAFMDQFKINGEIESWCDTGDSDNEKAITGREFLQNLGNEARNVISESLWIDLVLPNPLAFPSYEGQQHEIHAMYPFVDVVAITDLRYENEAQRVKDLGGVIWEVVRPGVESDGHASEQPLPRDLVDFQIVNDGTLDALDDKVMVAMASTL